MNDAEILTRLFAAIKTGVDREMPLKLVVDHVKSKPRYWEVWQQNKVHLVTFFTMEWKRAQQSGKIRVA